MMTNGSRAPTGSPNDTTATDLGVMQNFNGYRNNGNGKAYSPAANYVMSNEVPAPPSRQLFPPTPQTTANGNPVYPVSVTSTTTGDSCGSRMVAAPPPTPLDSRSHFSGLSSSGNSASAYSRSLISGASNSTGGPPNFPGGGGYAVHGGVLNGGTLGGQYHHPGDMMGAYNHWVLSIPFSLREICRGNLLVKSWRLVELANAVCCWAKSLLIGPPLWIFTGTIWN